MAPAALRTRALLLGRLARQIIREPRTSALGARMAAWIVLVSAAARMTSLPTVVRLVSFTIGRPRRHRHSSPEYLAQTIDRVLRLDLALFKPRCWKRSLVLYRYLTMQGVACRINFGVRRENGGVLAGHAWLERDGRPFLDADALSATYMVTFTLPPVAGEQPAAMSGAELPLDG